MFILLDFFCATDCIFCLSAMLLTHIVWSVIRELGLRDHFIITQGSPGVHESGPFTGRGAGQGTGLCEQLCPVLDPRTRLPLTLWRSFSLHTFTHAAHISGTELGYGCMMKSSNAWTLISQFKKEPDVLGGF